MKKFGLIIDKSELYLLGIFKKEIIDNNHYTYTYLVRTTKNINEYTMQEEEVSELKYIKIDDLEKMIENEEPNLAFSKKNYSKTIIQKLKTLI